MPPQPDQPLFRTLYNALRSRIASGEWPEDHRLPSETELVKSTGLSQGTVRKALTALVAAELVVRRQGRGTFVARQTAETRLAALWPFVDASGMPLSPEFKSQAVTQVGAPPYIAAPFGIERDRQLWCVERLLCVRNRPAILQRVFIRTETADLARLTGGMDIHGYLRMTKGVTVADVDTRIRSGLTGARSGWILRLPAGAPVLQAISVARDLNDRIVDVTQSLIANGPWLLGQARKKRESGERSNTTQTDLVAAASFRT